MNPPLIFFGCGGLIIVVLFIAKLYLVQTFTRRKAAFCFVTLLVVAIPLAWAISPDWNNPSVAQISNWIGTPIVLLTVPAVSLLIDLSSPKQHPTLPTNAIELLIGVPVWFFCWLFVEFAILGWVWI